MKAHGNTWAIVLAAGNGQRLQCLTTGPDGVAVPKQFCSLQGGPSLLHQALRRAATVAHPQHTCVVVAEQHREFWGRELREPGPGLVVSQPANRGTAIGILLPLLHIMRSDPQARVVLLPSDHFVADEPLLAAALRRAVQVIKLQPQNIVLLGMEPACADAELGYIVPGAVNGPGTSAVRRFVEKPPSALAAELMDSGALWNAFIIAADGSTFATLFKTRIPGAYAQVQAVARRGAAAAAVYAQLPSIDFSREILEGSESILGVMRVGVCGWTDLGTPQRVAEVLRRMPRSNGARGGLPQLREALLSLRKFRIADRTAIGVKSALTANRGVTFMKTDTEIRRDVQTELEWDPSLDESKVGVIVHNGVVTLTGEVAQFADRWNAEDITKRVAGVVAIANEIQVRIPIAGARSDTDIAEAAANALRWHVATAHTQIKPVVKDGWVTLSGEANWGFQRNAAEAAMRHLLGVKGVTNNIKVATLVQATDVKRKIEDAFKRHALLDANDIEVKVDGGTVTLQGRVHTWQEREDAARASWAAPGVANVENRLSVQ